MQTFGKKWAKDGSSNAKDTKEQAISAMFSDASAWLKWLEIANQDDVFIVYPDCEEAIKLFFRINHLWRYAPMGGILGLDWLQIQAYLQLINIKPTPQDIEDIRIIESSVVKELN